MTKIGEQRARFRRTTGLFRGVPFADYLALPGRHFSTLKSLDVSALHYRRACESDTTDSAALRVGSVTHAMILTPNAPAGVAIYDGSIRSGKAWSAFVASHPGKLIVKRDELATAERMRAAVMAHPVAARLLATGEGEVTVRWTAHGELCRARVDWLRPCGSMVELKSTRLIQPRAFSGEFARRLYHAQAAFYLDGLTMATNRQPPELPMVIVVENQEPHDVCVYRLGHDSIEVGQRKVDGWLRAVAACSKSGRWPGVSDEAMHLRLPDWALTDGLDDVDLSSLGDGS